MQFALGASKLFDLSAKSEFVETIICSLSPFSPLIEAKCVDRYIATQIHAQDGPSSHFKDGDEVMLEHDERLEAVVERMFEWCIEEKEFSQVHLSLAHFDGRRWVWR